MESRHAIGPYAWMLLGSLAFAMMATFTHAAGDSCSWQVIAMVRSGCCLVLTFILALAARVQLVFLRPPTLWLRSLAGSISLVCTFYALPRLPVSDVLTLTNIFPIWVALLSWPVLGEIPSARVWLAAASGIVGVVFIQQPHLAEGNAASGVALVSSLSTAIAMIGLHRLQGIDPRAVVVHFSAVSLVFCAAAFFLEGDGWQPAVPAGAGSAVLLAGVGLTATAGQLCLTQAFATGSPAKVSVVGLSQVVIALVLDLIVWNRTIGVLTLLGIALILVPTGWLMLQSRQEEAEEHADL